MNYNEKSCLLRNGLYQSSVVICIQYGSLYVYKKCKYIWVFIKSKNKSLSLILNLGLSFL